MLSECAHRWGHALARPGDLAKALRASAAAATVHRKIILPPRQRFTRRETPDGSHEVLDRTRFVSILCARSASLAAACAPEFSFKLIRAASDDDVWVEMHRSLAGVLQERSNDFAARRVHGTLIQLASCP